MAPEPSHGLCAAPPGSPPLLRLVFWETTARCNLQCVHCRRTDQSGNASGDLTGDEARHMIADLADHWPGLILVFSGGEPLMRGDTLDLAREARGRGLAAALATNGTLVTPVLAAKIAEAGFRRVSVSLDGATSATHDALRGQTGSFDAALRGLRLLRDAAVPVQINMSITRRNAAELDPMFRLAEAERATALHIFIVVPVGCGMSLGPEDRLSPDEYERLLGEFYRRSAASPLEAKATCAPQYARLVRQVQASGGKVSGEQRRPSPGGGCLAGMGVCFVGHGGEVFPCGYLPVSCGNVRETRLSQLWATSDVFARLRDRRQLGGKCGCCEFATVCGGCRARAFAATGDWMAEEPDCLYQPRGR
jgi:radical SAM protein with 4Fe4S-binding SPASM domain